MGLLQRGTAGLGMPVLEGGRRAGKGRQAGLWDEYLGLSVWIQGQRGTHGSSSFSYDCREGWRDESVQEWESRGGTSPTQLLGRKQKVASLLDLGIFRKGALPLRGLRMK